MKRVSSVLVGISLLLTSLGFGLFASTALAMTGSGNSGSSCSSGFPAPYTGGASVVKFFHLSDGSTVTITSTGAVIKQSPCGNPYREGWLMVSEICSIDSPQDLIGHLSSGSTNPTGSTGFTGCDTVSQPASTPQTSSNVTIINNNSQSQSQAQSTGPGTQATATASTTKATATTTSAQSQVQAATTSAVKTLPNTGPGNVLMLSGATSAVGTIGHWYYSRRRK